MSGPEGQGSVSSAFLARLAARTRLRRWSRTRAVLVGLGVLTVVAVLAWVVFGSSLLSVRKVEVAGVTGKLAQRVAAAVEDEKGTPLARVDLDAVAAEVEDVPGTANVVVSRGWPSTLRVEVTARRQAAVVRDGGTYRVVDLDGVTLSTPSKRPAGLPLVTVGGGAGAQLTDGLRALRDAPSKVRARTERVVVRSAEDIRLELDKGVVVKWGNAQEGPRKAEVLAALLRVKATVYDVSAPDLPTTRS